jgi:hypothetical protein
MYLHIPTYINLRNQATLLPTRTYLPTQISSIKQRYYLHVPTYLPTYQPTYLPTQISVSANHKT